MKIHLTTAIPLGYVFPLVLAKSVYNGPSLRREVKEETCFGNGCCENAVELNIEDVEAGSTVGAKKAGITRCGGSSASDAPGVWFDSLEQARI